MSRAVDKTTSLFSAGSLRDAPPSLIARFEAGSRHRATVRLGPAGLPRLEIERGARADVLLSADLARPLRLGRLGLSGEIMPLASNTLQSLIRRASWDAESDLLELLPDPAVRIGTSTPGKDPSGDCAWAMFEKAGLKVEGADLVLMEKAHPLVGRAVPLPGMTKESPIAAAFDDGSIDGSPDTPREWATMIAVPPRPGWAGQPTVAGIAVQLQDTVKALRDAICVLACAVRHVDEDHVGAIPVAP